jgi:hypothetical protein
LLQTLTLDLFVPYLTLLLTEGRTLDDDMSRAAAAAKEKKKASQSGDGDGDSDDDDVEIIDDVDDDDGAVKQKKIDEDDDCPVCYELLVGKAPVVWCKAQCGSVSTNVVLQMLLLELRCC